MTATKFRADYLSMMPEGGDEPFDGWVVLVPYKNWEIPLFFEDVEFGKPGPGDLVFVHDFITGSPYGLLNFPKSERRLNPGLIIDDYVAAVRIRMIEFERKRRDFWLFMMDHLDPVNVVNIWPEKVSDADSEALEVVVL